MTHKSFLIPFLLAGMCLVVRPAYAISQDSIDVKVASTNADINSGACLEYIEESGPNVEYHKTIRNLYVKDRGYEFSYYVIPSFGIEYSLGYNSGKSALEYRYTSSENQTAHPGSDRTIETAAVVVPEDFAQLLSELISAAVEPSHVRHYVRTVQLEDENVGWELIRLDGDIHEFYDKSGNAAQCWSPMAGNCKELVQLMQTICRLVEENKPDELANLKPDIRTLAEKFGK